MWSYTKHTESALNDDGGENELSLGTISGMIVSGGIVIIIGGSMSLIAIFLFKKKGKTKSVGM